MSIDESTPEITYRELTRDMINDSVVRDINHLLSQLSSKAAPLTMEWLYYVLDSGTRIFIAQDGKRIIGTVLLSPMVILVGQKDWIEDVVIDAGYRRRGIAGTLMDHAELASRDGKAKSINLTSKPDRHGARQMYGDRGYKIRETGLFRLEL